MYLYFRSRLFAATLTVEPLGLRFPIGALGYLRVLRKEMIIALICKQSSLTIIVKTRCFSGVFYIVEVSTPIKSKHLPCLVARVGVQIEAMCMHSNMTGSGGNKISHTPPKNEPHLAFEGEPRQSMFDALLAFKVSLFTNDTDGTLLVQSKRSTFPHGLLSSMLPRVYLHYPKLMRMFP